MVQTSVFVAVVNPAKIKPSSDIHCEDISQNPTVTQNYGTEIKGQTTVFNDRRVFLNLVKFPIRSKNSAFEIIIKKRSQASKSFLVGEPLYILHIRFKEILVKSTNKILFCSSFS